MNEEDRATPLISRFYDVELDATTACHSMSFHRVLRTPAPLDLALNERQRAARS